MSEIDVLVNDCEGCVITAYSTVAGGEPKTWAAPPVKNGKTVLTVPRSETASMSFDVRGADAATELSYIDARPAIALAERGTGANQEANWCWQGATKPITTLKVTHRKVDVPAAEQAQGGDKADVFQADPELPVVDGHWQKTRDGGLGHQDAPYCSASR
jgi:hypothetical protein